MRVSRLRISGFKSFVDTVELSISSGLTGIVGPNGCGKSNLVEALSWAMGESSARRMRGGEMNDVIFAGTKNHPVKDIAEVTLWLDNRDRSAPSGWNAFDEISVSRRLERGFGSSYRINGETVLLRKLQLLFADLGTGAGTSAIVGQGRLASLIEAKPTERRLLLEEAAGIRGLEARRNEAKLRLQASEANMTRLQDIRNEMQTRLQALKKQAREAETYRALSRDIHSCEMQRAWHYWRALLGKEKQGEAKTRALRSQEDTLKASLAQPGQRSRDSGDSDLRKHEEALLELRAEHAGLKEQLLIHTQAATERNTMRSSLNSRVKEAESDFANAKKRLEEAECGLRELHPVSPEKDLSLELAQTQSELAHLQTELHKAERQYQQDNEHALTQRAAWQEAQRRARTRVEKLEIQISEMPRSSEPAKPDLEQKIIETNAKYAEAERTCKSLERESALHRNALARGEARQSEILASARASLQGIEAEIRTLRNYQQPEEVMLFAPLIDFVEVDHGYETVLSAALGEDIDAPVDHSAPVHWHSLPPLESAPALPAGVSALSDHVRAPASLSRRLSQIGVVASNKDGDRLRPELAVGQRLVSQDGAVWRWDGYTACAGMANAGARKLTNRARLRELTEILHAQRTRLQQEKAETTQTLKHLRAQAENTGQQLAEAQKKRDEIAQHIQELLAEQSARILQKERNQKRQWLCDEYSEAQSEYEKLQAPDAINASLRKKEQAKTMLLKIQEKHDTVLQALKQKEEQQKIQRAESRSRQDKIAKWQEQKHECQRILTQLKTRIEAARQDLQTRPEQKDSTEKMKKREMLLAERIGVWEEKLERIRTLEAEREKTRLKIEYALQKCREERIRAENSLGNLHESKQRQAERIKEQFGCSPDQLQARQQDILESQRAMNDAEFLAIIEEKKRKRETLGEVNLRATEDTRQLQAQLDALDQEREDVCQAIEESKKAILAINRKAQERLLEVFDRIQTHFQDIFKRLFEGGEASLQLTDRNNPLESGLELMARPPGKRLQRLSLLSGGEQVLAALALLFAVFLVRSVPICVLDEVDAPLDDVNVDKFCSLVEELARATHMHFLIVTHHRMTMSRMDRLYGITMARPGISQLASVELGTARRFVRA